MTKQIARRHIQDDVYLLSRIANHERCQKCKTIHHLFKEHYLVLKELS